MCRLRNIAMRDCQESVTIGQTDTRTHRQTPDKVIPMCRYASQATQKLKVKSQNPPMRAWGMKSRMCPPYPQRDRKRRLNGAVCRNHRIKRVVPCRC